ncbi:hypothetical protein [Streptomyces sp. SD15]
MTSALECPVDELARRKNQGIDREQPFAEADLVSLHVLPLPDTHRLVDTHAPALMRTPAPPPNADGR